jgi:biotin carboxyl carrier protein
MSDLTFQDVLDILRLIDSVPSSDFQIEFEGTKLKVTRRTVAALNSSAGMEPIQVDARPAEPSASAVAPTHSVSPRDDENQALISGSLIGRSPVELLNRIDVKSPMAGTYYSAPGPGAAPFVEVNHVVQKGATLGIVEVMKLFTPVLSPCGGTVRAILVGNEEFVQSDQMLMIIEAAE